MRKNQNILLMATLLLAIAAVLAVPLLEAASSTILTSTGVPAVTVTTVTLNPAGVTCGVEIDCARVSWSVNPNGATIKGFTVNLTVTRANGTIEKSSKTADGKATSVDLPAAFQTGSNPVSFNVNVTANYDSSVSASKTATL